MLKRYLMLIAILFLIYSFIQVGATENINDEIIATINNENIYLSDFNRLLKAQKNLYEKELDFNLFSKTKNEQAISKRASELSKAQKEITITEEELNNSWNKLITEFGGSEKLESKAKENNLSLEEIKNKLKENLSLERYFEKVGREKLVELMLNEMIFLQEAKARDLKISEEDINKKINFIKQREGGDEAFEKFLQANNATIEDAKKEIKNQLISKFIKAILQSENVDLKSFLTEKKEKATIIVYNDKILQKEQANTEIKPEAQTTQTVQQVETVNEAITLRTKEYPIISKSKLEEIKNLEEKTNEIIQESGVTEQEAGISTKPRFSLKKLFKIDKDPKEEVPLLTNEQQKDLEKHFREKQEISIEEITDKDGETTTEIKTQSSELQSLNIQQAQILQDKKEVVELSKLSGTQVIEPINKPKERKRFLHLSFRPKGARLAQQSWVAQLSVLSSKLSNSTKSLKENLKKIKFAKKETNKETKAAESLVPGEEITMKEGLVVGIPKVTNKESEVKEIKTQSVDINTLNVLKNSGGLQNIQTKDTFSKELEELRRKIEERKVGIK